MSDLEIIIKALETGRNETRQTDPIMCNIFLYLLKFIKETRGAQEGLDAKTCEQALNDAFGSHGQE